MAVLGFRLVRNAQPVGIVVCWYWATLQVLSLNLQVCTNWGWSAVSERYMSWIHPNTGLRPEITEAEWLYQCLYVTYFSRHVDLIPSQALAALHRLGTFTDVDFGDWQLSVGEVGTRWQGISFYCTLSHLDSLPSGCRIFTRWALLYSFPLSYRRNELILRSSFSEASSPSIVSLLDKSYDR